MHAHVQYILTTLPQVCINVERWYDALQWKVWHPREDWRVSVYSNEFISFKRQRKVVSTQELGTVGSLYDRECTDSTV